MNYIGADVHISSVTFTVKDKKGSILDRTTIATRENLIVNYVTSIRGKKHLTFEQGNLAQWLYSILHDKVDKLIICDPRKNALIYKGNSNDDIDSEKLAELLRLNALSEVKFPPDLKRQEFRELINLWIKIQKDKTRIKNRIKASFRMKGIRATGVSVYNEDKQEGWLRKLSSRPVTKECIKIYFKQLSFIEEQSEIIFNEIRNKSKQFPEIKELMSVQGVGLKTAAIFSAFIFTPYRFKKKANLISYCALSLVENDTGKEHKKSVEKKRKKKVKRRLTLEGNKKVKGYLKSAAQVGSRCKDGILRDRYDSYLARGLDSYDAISALTRYLAVHLWGVWKNVEKKI